MADGNLRLKARSSLSVIDNLPNKLPLDGYMSEGNNDPRDLLKKLAKEKQDRKFRQARREAAISSKLERMQHE